MLHQLEWIAGTTTIWVGDVVPALGLDSFEVRNKGIGMDSERR